VFLFCQHFEQSAEPHKSRFSFVILPSAEKLERSANQSQNSHNIQEVEQLVADLAVNQHADRVINYRYDCCLSAAAGLFMRQPLLIIQYFTQLII